MATERAVRNGLRELPINLRNAYQQIYDRILAQQSDSRQIALNAFRWIKFSCEPVRSETLLDAASVDISPSGEFSHEPVQPNVLLKSCQNLIILDKSLNVFRFAHLSVEEFFDVTLSTEDSHTEIAQTCLSLICTPNAWDDYDPNTETSEGRHHDRHLLLYSAAFWPWHFARAKDCAILDNIWDAFMCLINHQRWSIYFGKKVSTIWDDNVHWKQARALSAQNISLMSCVSVFGICRKFPQIIDSCAPTTIDLNALLSSACRFGDLEISRLLIDKGSDVTASDDDGQTPLHHAVMEGHEGVARLLLDNGADVTATDNATWTPLERASDTGNKGMVQLLIEKGANATATDKNGVTPLHIASYSWHEEVVGLLIDKGADPSASRKDGQSPLHWTSASGKEVAVRLLIDKGAEVTAVDKDGRTPLHLAVTGGHDGVVRLLVDKGADATVADNDGRTPLFLMESGMPAIAAQLLSDNAVGKRWSARD